MGHKFKDFNDPKKVLDFICQEEVYESQVDVSVIDNMFSQHINEIIEGQHLKNFFKVQDHNKQRKNLIENFIGIKQNLMNVEKRKAYALYFIHLITIYVIIYLAKN